VRFPVRVYFEDTDFSGRVYHGAHIRFLERGRTETLRAAGIDHKSLAARDDPLYFALRALDVRFLGPAVIDDLLEVETVPAGEARAAFVLRQRILRDGAPIVTARAELCLVDGRGRPRRPPAAVRAALQESQRS
jgi:acyl-CoA thioester hydrolase